MSFRITCEFCHAKLTVRSDKIGGQFKCPACRRLISAPSVSSCDQTLVHDSADDEADTSFEGDYGDFNFTEEYGLDGLLPESDHSADGVSRMPPTRKKILRSQKNEPIAVVNSERIARPGSANLCSVCKKQLSSGVRYCIGCGHNNFDADAAAMDVHLTIQSRMSKLAASLGAAHILKIFSRLFR